MRRSASALLVALFGVGCGSLTDAASFELRSVLLADAPPLVQPIHVSLTKPGPIDIVYWTDSGPRLRQHSEAALEHVVQLTRLRPNETYQYNIVGTEYTGTFRTAPLPDDLQSLTFTASGNGTVPLVLLHLYNQDGFRGYVVVDGSGAVVWYWRTMDFPYGATRRSNGNFVFMDKARGLVEVTPAGVIVNTLAQSTDREMHHDVVATHENTLFFIAYDERVVQGARVLGEAIWEWSPESGTATQRWTSWDHLSVTADRGPRFGLEWMHANALSIGPRHNVLFSVHFFNQIISISHDLTRVEWRVGGVNSTIALADNDAFSGQHTPTELPGERLLLFDNGLERRGPSRAVEYELVGGRAERRWQWVSPQRHFSSAVSSARRLQNGHTLIGFGMSAGLNNSTGGTEVFEVDGAGHDIWRLRVTGTRVMFRAEPLTAIGFESAITP